MEAVAGPVWIAAVLLVLSGAGKVLRPAPTREALQRAALPSRDPIAGLIGAAELLVAGAVLAVGGPLPAAALAITYLAFTAFLLRLRARAGAAASCSCLGGTTSTPVTASHVVLNLVVAALAGVAVLAPVAPAWDVLAATPWSGTVAVALVALGAALARALYTELPPVLDAARVLATDSKGDR